MERKEFRILLIEDDEVDILNVKRAFRKNQLPHTLWVARDGVQAIEMLTGTGGMEKIPKPEFILLDINMPRMNGLEFLRELRKMEGYSDCMVFVMTTSNEDSDKVNAYNQNVAGYIVKPLSFDAFQKAIGTLGDYWQLTELP